MLKIEYIKKDDLKPYVNNAKIHTGEQVEQIKKSIREFGFNDPIAVWHENEIIEGHGRLLAVMEMSEIEDVPIIRLDELSDEQRKAYTLVHNKLTMNTDFDLQLLNLEPDDITDIDMTEFGFDLDFDDDEVEESEKEEVIYFENELIQNKVVEAWQETTLDDFIKTIIDEPTAMYQFNRLCSGYNEGYNISLLFNPHRLDTDTVKHKSILYGYNEDAEYRKQFARYMVNVSAKVVPQTQYYKYIGIGTAGYQYVNEFQPYLARDIYKKFCKDGDKILNPCAGWGGRLLGIASSRLQDIEYIETEPATQTYNGLVKLKDWLGLDDNYKQYNLPFEQLELKENYFDFAFTSPPYFNTEIYSDEDTQSAKNQDSYASWRDNWYIPFIDKILFTLKVGGKALLNVGNARYPMEKDLKQHLKELNIEHKNILDFKIGGSGIGDRTGEDGEPFVLFVKS